MFLVRFRIEATTAAIARDQILRSVRVLVNRLRLELVHWPVIVIEIIHRCLKGWLLNSLLTHVARPFCHAKTV